MVSLEQTSAGQARFRRDPLAVPGGSGEPAPGTTGRWAGARRLGARGLLVIWIPMLILGIGSLMAGHWTALPRPSLEEPDLAGALTDLGAEMGRGDSPLHAFHVLDGACRCSRRVAQHLMDSDRPAGAAETVLLIGTNEALQRELEAAGFPVRPMGREEAAASLGLTSVPMMLITGRLANGTPTLRYSGGYTARQQSLEIQDTTIIAGLLHGSTPGALPVFGCGTTTALQAALDPLRIKY